MGNKHDKPLLLQNPSKIKDIIIPIKKLYIPPFSNIQKFANKNIKTKLKTPIKKLYIPPFSNIQKFANKNIKTKLKTSKNNKMEKSAEEKPLRKAKKKLRDKFKL